VNKIRILCVDDERNVLRALERVFMDEEYEILTASGSEEGLELLDAAPQVQVVIADYRMPGMNGVEFLRQVCKTHPDTIRIVLSGYADTASVVAAINEGKIYKFIPKPWNDDELKISVAKALETFVMRRRNVQLTDELRSKNEELKELNASLERLVQQRTAELHRQNRALLHARDVLDHLPVGVVGIGTDGTVQQLNREAARMLGVKSEDVLGKAVRQALPWFTSPPAAAASGDVCSWLPLQVNGEKLLLKGITVLEEGAAGVILTLMRNAAGPAGTAEDGGNAA